MDAETIPIQLNVPAGWICIPAREGVPAGGHKGSCAVFSGTRYDRVPGNQFGTPDWRGGRGPSGTEQVSAFSAVCFLTRRDRMPILVADTGVASAGRRMSL